MVITVVLGDILLAVVISGSAVVVIVAIVIAVSVVCVRKRYDHMKNINNEILIQLNKS